MLKYCQTRNCFRYSLKQLFLIDDFSISSCPYYFGNTEIKSLDFVDDIADLNEHRLVAKLWKICKTKNRLNFSAEKCELLRINPKFSGVGDSLTVNNAQVKMVEFACYLGD